MKKILMLLILAGCMPGLCIQETRAQKVVTPTTVHVVRAPSSVKPRQIPQQVKNNKEDRVKQMTNIGEIPIGTGPGNPAKSEDLQRRGPDWSTPFFLSTAGDIYTEDNIDALLDINKEIYRDANIKSGYYYYIPASYTLAWISSSQKYDFEVTYGSGSEDKAGKVTVTAILYPKINNQDLEIAREILGQKLKGTEEEKYGIRELLPMPMEKAPEIDLKILGKLDIEEGGIQFQEPAELTDPVYLSFTVNADRINELMEFFFIHGGLSGRMQVYPKGKNMAAQLINLYMTINQPETFGNFELEPGAWRKTGWKNTTDYPLVLTCFNVLKKENNGAFAVYTWKTGDVEVPVGATAKFDAALVPDWIDNAPNIKRIWLDYVVRDCEECNARVQEKISGTVNPGIAVRPDNIEFIVFSPLQETKASMIRIKVRSYQATIDGNTQLELSPVTVQSDNSSIKAGPLYFKDGKVDFEYQIQVFLNDEIYSSEWIQSSNKEIPIGMKQIKENIPFFNQ